MTEEDSTVTVVLDTNLSDALIEEGFVREIISKIQTMRKEAGFEVMDKIVVYSMGNQKIEGYMKEYREEILSDVMAVSYTHLSGQRDLSIGIMRIPGI